MIYHTIQHGEDLWFLAEYYYGDASLWDLIYYHNRDLIGDDPEALPFGARLLIPALPVGNKILTVPEVSVI